MKRILAGGKKLRFADIMRGVLAGGAAGKFAVRSALNKARTKGVVKFADGEYWMPAQKKSPVPPSRRGNGNTGPVDAA